MPNRLADESSPYLLQHRDNPVDWYPWGVEAFERARLEDKPIFLSIGYSSCHWCHVMAHESFESAAVAAELNRNFISVKVDREERPDVDEAYMTAVQLMSGRGGWPMSVFMTPDRRPFFAGTYFAAEDRGQVPGFITICRHIAASWSSRREELETAAAQMADAIRDTMARPAPSTEVRFDRAFVDRAVETILSDFDPENAGFGGAPKFPPHSAISFLLSYGMTEIGERELRQQAMEAAMLTLVKMEQGGIHDHVGGGFHRYSTDAHWLLPHFEKTLYDNALMIANYAWAGFLLEEFDPGVHELFMATAIKTAFMFLPLMQNEAGLLGSAFDADSEGEEGRHYVWTASEVRSVLGPRAAEFMRAYGFQEEGNFRDEATGRLTGANIPHRTAGGELEYQQELAKLFEVRLKRVRPLLDTKALVAWNALAIKAYVALGDLAPAVSIVEGILAAEVAVGTLPHQITDLEVSGEGFLDDYAFFSDALFVLSGVQMDESGGPLPRPLSAYRAEAERLGHEMVERFYDEKAGGFFGTSDRHEFLFGRSKPIFDQPVPSGNSEALRVLVRLGDLERAQATVQAMMGWMERAPHATEAFLEAALPLLRLAAEVRPDAEKPRAPEAQISARPRTAPSEVSVRLSAREIPVSADGIGLVEVRIQIPEGFHINSNDPPARWLTPTRVEVRPLKAEVAYPPAREDRFVDEVVIPVRIQLPAGKSAGEFEISVGYQACTESECLAPTQKTFDGVLLRG